MAETAPQGTEVITWDQVMEAVKLLGFNVEKGFMRLEILGRTEVAYTRIRYKPDGSAVMEGPKVVTHTVRVPIKRGRPGHALPPVSQPPSRPTVAVAVVAVLVVVFFAGWIAGQNV